MPKYVRKVTIRDNLQKWCAPCDECLNQLIIPAKEIIPLILQNFGNIEISVEIIAKFVTAGLKNASINEKIKSSLEATRKWSTRDYAELVMFELMFFFTKDIINKVMA